jgi:hypothetical protein
MDETYRSVVTGALSDAMHVAILYDSLLVVKRPIQITQEAAHVRGILGKATQIESL